MSPERDLYDEMFGWPLDDDTAERLLSGTVAPEDAPAGYGAVAELLRSARGPAVEAERRGEAFVVRAAAAAVAEAPAALRAARKVRRRAFVPMQVAAASVVGALGLATAAAAVGVSLTAHHQPPARPATTPASKTVPPPAAPQSAPTTTSAPVVPAPAASPPATTPLSHAAPATGPAPAPATTHGVGAGQPSADVEQLCTAFLATAAPATAGPEAPGDHPGHGRALGALAAFVAAHGGTASTAAFCTSALGVAPATPAPGAPAPATAQTGKATGAPTGAPGPPAAPPGHATTGQVAPGHGGTQGSPAADGAQPGPPSNGHHGGPPAGHGKGAAQGH